MVQDSLLDGKKILLVDDEPDVLDTLDRASLAQQRPLSIPFVKATLSW